MPFAESYVTLGRMADANGQDGIATSAFERWCLAHPLQESAYVYCDMTSFGVAAQWGDGECKLIEERVSLQEVMRSEERAGHQAMAIVGLIALEAFFCGYGLHVWESWRANSVYEWCVSHRGFFENGRLYCDATSFGRSRVGEER